MNLANSGDEDEDATDLSDADEAARKPFDPVQCLFCNQQSSDFTENMNHMQQLHGLFIPSPESLIVDLETLVGYLHLVIFEYTECLYCGSVRNTSQGAQQHMLGKRHCRIDITKESSEFRDFYDFGNIADPEDDKGTGIAKIDGFVDVDEKTRRLATGKIVTHRTAQKPRSHQYVSRKYKATASTPLLEEGIPRNSGTSSALTLRDNGKRALTTAEKRDMLFNKQLATLRAGDRQALMHLPLSQQRSVVATAKRQQEKWNRARIAQEIKWQTKANP